MVHNLSAVWAFTPELRLLPALAIDTGLSVISLSWHRRSARLFLTGANGWVKAFCLRTERTAAEFVARWEPAFTSRASLDWVVSLAFDEFLGYLYGAVESSVAVFDLQTGEFRFRLENLHDRAKIFQVYVDPESSVLTTSGSDGTVRFWSVRFGRASPLIRIAAGPPGFTTFTRQGRFVITATADRVIRHFHHGDGTLHCEIAMGESVVAPDPMEVVRPVLIVLENMTGVNGSLCTTAYKTKVQAALLGIAGQEEMTMQSEVLKMAYSEREKSLLCLCADNFIVSSNRVVDVSMASVNISQRSGVANPLSFCVHNDTIFIGLKNGALKCIDIVKNECTMMEACALDEPISYVGVYEGVFCQWHPMCGGVHPKATDVHSPFIVGYSSKRKFSIWCGNCLATLFRQEMEIELLSTIVILPSRSMVFLGGDQSIVLYEIQTSSLGYVGQMHTSGNQKITSFVVTDQLRVIAGTSSGEVIIADLDLETDTGIYVFRWKNHFILHLATFRMHFDIDLGIVGVCLADGTLLALNPNTATFISEKRTMDALPLCAAWFQVLSGEFHCFIAFGNQVHCVQIEAPE
jgi:WD40 repeat protein